MKRRIHRQAKHICVGVITDKGSTYIVHAQTAGPIQYKADLTEETGCLVRDLPTTETIAYV